MSDWSDEFPEGIRPAPEPRPIPKWLKISIAASVSASMGLFVVAGVWLVRYVRQVADYEMQWSAIREVIAVDDPPPRYGVAGMPGWWEVSQTWALSDPASNRFAMLLFEPSEEAAGNRTMIFDPETQEIPGNSSAPSVPLEHGRIAVQGRDLRCVRFAYVDPSAGTGSDRSRPAILVELSRDNSSPFLALMMMVADGGVGRVEDVHVVDFLKPFHVGPDR